MYGEGDLKNCIKKRGEYLLTSFKIFTCKISDLI